MTSIRFITTALAAFVVTVFAHAHTADEEEWSGWAGNIYNNRWASTNTHINSHSIRSLTPHCKKYYDKGVSATPVLKDNIVYYPTWNGLFVALDFVTCRMQWQINVTEIILDYKPLSTSQEGNVRPVSRTSPQIDGKTLYFGTLAHALIIAVDRFSGEVLGKVQINTHPFAVVTMSPTFFDGKLFVGVASVEENLTLDPDYKCCTFVGNVLALRFDPSAKKPFSIVWNLPMIPPASAAMGWSGVGMWGSQPAIDVSRRQVFFASGNTYSLPDVIIACQNATVNLTAVVQGLVPDPCLPRGILQNSVIAVDIDYGILNWVHQLEGLDAFTAACGYPGFAPQNTVLCPEIPGPDYDFGMAPAFVSASHFTPYKKDIVVVGQKSGILYGISAQTGTLFWSTQTSPGGLAGGLSWGVAADNERAYFTAINWAEENWVLQPQGTETVNRSGYGAVSLSDGKIVWEVPVPQNGSSFAPPSVVGDLVLVGKTGVDVNGSKDGYDATNGSLVALDRATGRLVLDYVLDTNTHGGVAVRGDYVLLGLGYDGFGLKALVPGSMTVWRVNSHGS